MRNILFAFTFFFFYICNGAFADVWIQYDAATGAEVATNTQKVSDAELAKLGRAQILYTGSGDPLSMMVDLTQTPPAVVPAPPPPAPPADMITLIFSAMVQQGLIDPATVDPAILARANASLAVTGAKAIPMTAPVTVTTLPAR